MYTAQPIFYLYALRVIAMYVQSYSRSMASTGAAAPFPGQPLLRLRNRSAQRSALQPPRLPAVFDGLRNAERTIGASELSPRPNLIGERTSARHD